MIPTNPAYDHAMVPAHFRPALEAFCRSHRVRTLRVFGSAARGTLTDQSDINLLLDFEPGVDPDLFELGGMQQELSDLFGRQADLKTPDMLSPRSLSHVLEHAVVQYAA